MADSELQKGIASLTSGVEFKGVNPILRVENLEASIDYYVNILGFKLNWKSGWFASVYRGATNLFLSQGDQGHAGTWVYVGVSDVNALHDGYKAAGAKIRHPPTNYEWTFEMQVEDLDGNILRLGSEPEKDMPCGEFLDMYGVRWAQQANGNWTAVKEA